MNIVLLRFYSYPTPHYDRLAASLRAKGHTVWVGTLRTGSKFEWQDGSCTAVVQDGPANTPGWISRWHLLAAIFNRAIFLKFIFDLRRFLLAISPDIVQVNPNSMYFAWLLPLFMPGRIHFILHFCELLQHDETSLAGKMRNAWDNRLWQIMARYFYQRACFVNVIGAAKVLGDGWPALATIVPHGVGPGFLAVTLPARVAPKRDEPVRLIYLGIISRVRQLDRLLAAIGMARGMTDKFRVTFIGSDATGGFFQDMVGQLGLEANVTIKPPLPYTEIPEVVAAYDIALAYVPGNPPDWQYYPTLKVQEYRAVGVPIIATDFKPNRQFVQAGVNGLLVPNTVEAWASAVVTVTINRDFLRSCQANARRMRQGKTWHEIAGIWETDVYRPACSGVLSSLAVGSK